jgi:hypothetical protein
MLALIGAVCFAVALLLDWTSEAGNTIFNHDTLMLLGLILVALHLAGIGAGYDWRRRTRYTRRRR